jgi:hypothetical protein
MPDPVPAELAPFLANARHNVAAAIEGLQPDEAVRHLQTTVAQAEIEASKLGIRFDEPTAIDGEPLTVTDGGPVVVIRRLVEPDDDVVES